MHRFSITSQVLNHALWICCFRSSGNYINRRNSLSECVPQLSQAIKCVLDHDLVCVIETFKALNVSITSSPFYVRTLICQEISKIFWIVTLKLHTTSTLSLPHYLQGNLALPNTELHDGSYFTCKWYFSLLFPPSIVSVNTGMAFSGHAHRRIEEGGKK